MESGISEIEIWLNLWVSANNELGKVLEQGSTIAIVKNSQKDIRDGVRWEENMKKNVLYKEERQVLHLLKPASCLL